MSLIVLAAANDAFSKRVHEAVADMPAIVRRVDAIDGEESVDRIAGQDPAAVIVGDLMDQDAAFEIGALFDRKHPTVSVLLVTKTGPTEWKRAVQAGVRGLIEPTSSDEDLRGAIEEAVEAWGRHRSHTPSAQPGRARVITVISPKGGVGKTVLSTNLAVGMASRYHGSVALLDLDLKFGDASYALMLAPQHTMADAVGALPELSTTQFKVFLTTHTSGLFTLCAPEDPAQGDAITAEETAQVIELASTLFGHVIIDTGSGLDEHTLAAVEHSTDLIVISDMDVPSVRNVRKALDTLDLLGLSDHRRYFVLNRADSRVGLKKEDVRAAAAMPIDLEIPSSRSVPLSINEGRPIITNNPRSTVSRRIWDLVEQMSSVGARHHPPREGRSR